MKCLLLLLASGLVTSDKLDRTYLPPPGAIYSGGTFEDLNLPLEFPEETYTGDIQIPAGFDRKETFTKFSTYEDSGTGTPVGNSAFKFPNNLSATTQFLNNDYKTTVPTLRPVASFYGSIPSKSPSIEYLPSKESNVGIQSDFAAKPTPDFDATTSSINPYVDGKDTENNLYLPNMQLYRNDNIYKGPDNYRFPNVGMFQSPNKDNRGNIPKIINAYNVSQYYQPSLFGHYGGTPMIMTSQNVITQELEGMNFLHGKPSKFEVTNKNEPVLLKQENFNDNNEMPERPFPPLVQLNSNNIFKPTDFKTISTIPNAIASKLSTDTITTYSKNLPPLLEQRNKLPVRNVVKEKQRPQMEFERNAVIVSYENSISPEGYSYSYDTSNGIHADETGIATNGVRAKGSYSYTGDDGKIYTVSYTADENGFQPRGDHLPTAPPIPEAIQKVIEQAAKDKAAGITDDGSYDEKKYGHINYQGAMHRYRPFETNESKTARLNSNRRKPSRLNQYKNKEKFDNIPLNNGIVSKPNGLPNESPDILLDTMDHNVNIIESNHKGNKFNGKNELNPESIKNNKENHHNRRPVAFLNDDEFIPLENVRMMPDNRVKPKFETTNISNFNDKDQINQKEKVVPFISSKDTFTTDGYFYVPPVIKYNPNTRKPNLENNSYSTPSKVNPINIDTDTNKRGGFNDMQKIVNVSKKDSFTQNPFNPNNVTTEPTRQPYISGPDEQNKQMYDDSSVFSKTDTNVPTSYSNNINPIYSVNTTPMTTQTVQPSHKTQNPSQFPNLSTTNSTMFDQTLPNAAENRINIPSGNPGISVSQDLVTTTYRPKISGDGVLEVNQNVKIYGIGGPDITTAFNGYPEKIPDNNPLYSVTTINGEPTVHGEYLNSFYPGPAQDTAVFQANPNEYIPYGNGYSTRVPTADLDVTSEPFFNTGFGRVQGDPREPNTSIFNANTFENYEKIPVQETTPISNQNQDLRDKIIGENFTGPRQPQKFDQETGYYYK